MNKIVLANHENSNYDPNFVSEGVFWDHGFAKQWIRSTMILPLEPYTGDLEAINASLMVVSRKQYHTTGGAKVVEESKTVVLRNWIRISDEDPIL